MKSDPHHPSLECRDIYNHPKKTPHPKIRNFVLIYAIFFSPHVISYYTILCPNDKCSCSKRDNDTGEFVSSQGCRIGRSGNFSDDVGRIVDHVTRIQRAIPTVSVETGGACIGDGRVGLVQRAGDDGAGNASGPLGIDGGITHGGDVVAVFDDEIAFGGVVGGVEGRDVGLVDVGSVGDVDDQGGWACGIGGVATEETGAFVESEVDECVLAGDRGECGSVCNGFVLGTLVGCNEGCSVGPEVGGVGG